MSFLKDLAQAGAGRFDYEIRKISRFDSESDAQPLLSVVRPFTMLPRERLLTLYQQVAYCERFHIPGSYVECGVWKGGAVGLMALANLRTSTARRHLHLFDSFQEICEPDATLDGDKAVDEAKHFSHAGRIQGRLYPLKGIYNSIGGPGTLEGSRDLLEQTIGYDANFIHYHKGWFQDTLPVVAPTISGIAILRLDGDWYASTKVCLEHLYAKVSIGGFVIIDDYGTYAGCKKAVDEFLQEQGIRAYLSHVDNGCRYWLKGR